MSTSYSYNFKTDEQLKDFLHCNNEDIGHDVKLS